MDGPKAWHRWLGLGWMDLFHGTDVTVEPEQHLDVLILRPGPLTVEVPDGFEGFAAHNLLPLTDFRLYALTTRTPEGLAGRQPLLPAGEGAYDLTVLGVAVRVVVIREVPRHPRNSLLYLFGGDPERLEYGLRNYDFRSPTTGPLLRDVLYGYLMEGMIMPGKYDEYLREMGDRMLEEIPVERRLKGIPVGELLSAALSEEKLSALSDDELLAALPPRLRELLRRAGQPE
ncbi:MAG: hypothetical protein ACRC33_04520 [Gemmataceae bacterium]